jgi:EAL domain-containing protein (putative c-di-GMP-specific phosphodiesterase class I)
LKIDKSVIFDLYEEKCDYSIVKSIISLGQALGFSIVAEGVKTNAQSNALLDLECKIAQGFFLGGSCFFQMQNIFINKNHESGHCMV